VRCTNASGRWRFARNMVSWDMICSKRVFPPRRRRSVFQFGSAMSVVQAGWAHRLLMTLSVACCCVLSALSDPGDAQILVGNGAKGWCFGRGGIMEITEDRYAYFLLFSGKWGSMHFEISHPVYSYFLVVSLLIT
jgi:hypothetical protein